MTPLCLAAAAGRCCALGHACAMRARLSLARELLKSPPAAGCLLRYHTHMR